MNIVICKKKSKEKMRSKENLGVRGNEKRQEAQREYQGGKNVTKNIPKCTTPDPEPMLQAKKVLP